jgi:hypothetical protein
MNGLKKMWHMYIKKNAIMSFAGKWIELEFIMSSEITQVQKDERFMSSLICERQIQKINEYINTTMIYIKCVCNSGTVLRD